MREPLAQNIASIVIPLGRALLPYLDRPFALLGHSMGSLICFELARYLSSVYQVQPALLIVSGGRSPELIENRKDSGLSDAEFVSVLRNLNGTPEEIFKDDEALELLLPILRADFRVTQEYRPDAGEALSCPIRAYCGAADKSVTPELVQPWQRHTTGPFSMTVVPGDHFFLHQSRDQFLRMIGADLVQVLDGKLHPHEFEGASLRCQNDRFI